MFVNTSFGLSAFLDLLGSDALVFIGKPCMLHICSYIYISVPIPTGSREGTGGVASGP